MNKLRHFLWTVSILIIMGGCRTVDRLPPPPSPQPLRIGLTPSLLPILQDRLAACERATPGVALLVQVKPHSSINTQTSDIIIQLGEDNLAERKFPIQLGWGQLELIAHPDLPLASLDKKTILENYTALSPEFQVWTYPPDHELRNLFERVFLVSEVRSPAAMIAPGPAEMVAAVSQNPTALGYVLDSWVTSEVNTFPVDSATRAALRQPILAVPRENPQGVIKSYLACLQNWEP